MTRTEKHRGRVAGHSKKAEAKPLIRFSRLLRPTNALGTLSERLSILNRRSTRNWTTIFAVSHK